MKTSRRAAPLVISFVFGIMCVLTACGGPPPTSSAKAACAGVTGFAKATGAYDPSGHFTDVPFPSDSLSYAAQFGEVATIQFQDINVCSAHTTTAGIQSFYMTQMATQGWAPVTFFPVLDDPRISCDTGALCWSKGTMPTRYVEVATSSNEGPVGNGVTYHVRLVVPPLATYTSMQGGQGDADITLEGNATADIHYTSLSLASGTVTWLNGAAGVQISPANFDLLTDAHLPQSGFSTSTINADFGAIYAYKTHDGDSGKLTFGTGPDSGVYIYSVTYPFSLDLATPTAPVCVSLSDFSSAGAATTGLPTFTDVPFPASSFSYVDPYAAADIMDDQVINVCSDGTTPSAVQSAYATMMASNGWTVATTFPAQGSASSHCPGDMYCWQKGVSPTRFVGLDFIDDEGGMGSTVTTYTLNLITAM